MIIYEREELYERVWSKPMVKLAKEDGISGRGLAKICERLDVPRPPRGYWAKVQAGYKPKRRKLPKLKKGMPAVYRRWVPSPDDRQPLSDEAQLLLDTAAELEKVVVHQELTEPHPLLESNLPRLRAEKPRSLRNTTRLHLPVRTDAVRERSICFMDAILKALSNIGVEVKVRKRKKVIETKRWGEEVAEFEPSKTVAVILGVDVQFGIDEQADSVKTTSQTEFRERLGMSPKVYYHNEPNETLALRIYSAGGGRSTWSDGKKQRVEHCINSFVVSLIETAETLRLREKRREQARLASIKREKQRSEERRQAAHEKKLVDDLEPRLDAFEQAERLRRYLDAFATRNTDVLVEQRDWFEWAERRLAGLEWRAFEKALPATEVPRE